MKRKISSLILSIILNPLAIFGIDFIDITSDGYEQYQDIIINNEVIQKASGDRRDNETRYSIIRSHLDKYKRPFTMLDIGASQGYYSFRAAHDYDCVSVMIEGNNRAYPKTGTQLLNLCRLNTELDNIIHLNKQIVPEDIRHLSECEHFDVVLGLNILHWMGDKWKLVADAMINMSDYVIIETPPQEGKKSSKENKKRKEIEEYLVSKGGQVLGKVKRHTSKTEASMYIIESKASSIQRKTWIKPILKDNRHEIVSSFSHKILRKELEYQPGTFVETEWLPGINLMTFKMYNGAHPSNEVIKAEIEKLSEVENNDWMPNNMIVQGKKVTMIDINDPDHEPGQPGGMAPFTQARLKKILDLVRIDEPKQFEESFWKDLIGVRRVPRR